MPRAQYAVGIAIGVTVLALVWIGIARFFTTGERDSLSLAAGLLLLLGVAWLLATAAGMRRRKDYAPALLPLLPLDITFSVEGVLAALCGLLFFLLVLFLIGWAAGRGFGRGSRRRE